MSESDYEAKFKEMQIYLPFIQRVIDRLKANNEEMADNPRKAQLEKMTKLHDLLTNKDKIIKVETLVKCESVIKRLQHKLEMQPSFQNEDALLNKVQLKRPSAPSPATINSSTQQVEESTCPASPPPEVHDDSLEQPIVIPTERRCSPILLKEKVKQLKKLSQTQTVKDSQHTSTHSIQDTLFSHGKYDNNRTASAPHHHNQHHHNRSYYDNRSSSQQLSHSHSSTPLPKEKPTATISKLQTVKVVITEPLPDHVKQQHFPSTSKYVPHTSVCYNNLKTLPQVSQEQDNEAYNPEELWQQYNESRNNSLKQTHSTSPVFKRLGSKVLETSPIVKEVKIPEISTLSMEANTTSTSKPSGRYTPIPDVLKSPPLSVNDINNLLLESGADKNDISAIGTRRPPKQETDLPNSPTNSFELSRKKLADSFKINFPVIENSKQRDDQDSTLQGKTESSTNLPNERVALKYNPHPRQERLQSVSSTDGSECSSQSKISDPRIKHKVITSPLPQSSLVNVNVLPAINFNDPRLKKQNFPNAPTNLRPQNMPPAPSSTPVIGYGQYQQQNSSNCMGRQDPRIVKQQNNIPPRRTSITQPHYSSEENWDSDDQDKTKMWNKSDPRLDKRIESRAESRYDNRFDNRPRSCTPKPDNRPRSCTPKPANYVNKSFSNTIAADVRDNSEDSNKSCSQLNASETNKKSMNKHKKETKSKIIPAITIPNPPKSDTEEDWDSEPEDGKNKSKPTAATSCESLSTPSTNNFDSNTQPIPTLNPLESAVKSTHPALQNYKTLLNYVTPPVHTTGLPSSKTYKPPTGNVNLSSNSYRPPIASHPATVISPSTSYRPVPTATHLPPQHTIPITGHNHSIPLQHPPANNHFNAGSFYERNEKFKYYESKTPTLRCETQPRTYKEFREAKERALAQEAALRRAAEAKREEEEALNEKEKGKEKLEEAQQIKDNQAPKDELNKKINEKKANAGDNNKTNNENKDKLKQKDKPNNAPAESTLDKMYRTQNFATQFPKASSSFKIPKKKTEGKPKEETKPTELAKPNTIERNNKTNKEPLNELESSKDEQKTTNESNVKSKENLLEYTKDKLHSRDPRCRAKTVQKTILDKENNKDTENKKQEDEVKEKNKESTKQLEQDLMKETEKKRSDENASENDDSKTSTNPESTITIPPNLGDIIVTSSDNQITLKPQQNLDKFIRLAQELSPKPQRILRRRNTMVVFDSAPLVDKEKLKKANAKLFEDVQDEERKRKKDEESRIARRNKNLEEMFKKTDDNCTVSTQNIIEGKRRTRPNMNFNETANVSKLFKHKTIKDSNALVTQSPTANDAVSAATSAKPTKSNFKIKLAKIDMKSAEQQNDEEIESNEFKNKPKTVVAKSKATIAKEIQDESDDPASEEDNSTKTKKVGPKSKTRKINKKLEDEEEESNSDEEQQKTIKLKKTKAKSKTAKTNKKQEETEEDSTDDDEHNKTKKSLKSKVSKTNKKLEDSEEESLKNEQNSKEEAKGTKAKKSGKNKITKCNKKPQASEESEESGEENISKESKQTKVNKSKKIKTTKTSKIQDDTEEETEYEKDEKSASKENKITKVKTKKTTKNLEDSNGEDNGKESDTKQQNKTKVVKRNACKIQNKSQLESTEEKEEENVQERDKEAKGTTLTKTKPTETNACKESKANEENSSEMSASLSSNNDADFKPNTSDNEHQHCAVSSTSTDNTPEEFQDETPTTSSTEKTVSTKKEIDDNEPSSTASKSLNATPTPEANVDVLNEIVEILINNTDRERVLGLFGVIGEEKLKLIKSILELNKQQKETNEEPKQIKEEKQKTPETSRNAKQNDNKEVNEAEDEEEDEDDKPLKSLKTPAEGRAKKQSSTHKKKRTELDRLNEDIREMFICEGVLTATGRRMCTIIGEKAEAVKKSPEQTEQINKRKSTSTRNIRRSLRGGTKAQDETEEDDDISLSTRNSEVSLDDVEKTSSAENSPQRKMPVLKPHTPIKIPEEVSTKVTKTKETNKRKSDDKLALKNKKAKLGKDETESEDKDSDTEAENEDDKTQEEGAKPITTLVPIKNNNVHWHYQSKFLTWCMICEKRLSAKTIAVHFKTHHGENYISRLAPVILQQFKQGKRNRPLFGVDKGQQRNSWFYRCPFCLQYFNTPLMLWLEHFLNHTVEFRYECSKCHRSNNRKQTVQRHIRYCEGSTILTSAVKLTVPTEIKAHVCHLCNFIQLKRPNLERHYIEQHQIDKKTVELSGYTIILFDVANVECVPEDKAAEREKQAWEFIKKNEQVIDIPDDDELDASTNVTESLDKSQEIDHKECCDNNTEKEIELEEEKNDSKAKQNEDSNKDSKSKEGNVFLHNEVIPKANITTAKKSKNSEVQLHKKQVTKKDSTLQNEVVVEKSQSVSETSSKKQSTADSINKLSENIIENQGVVTIPKELASQKKQEKTDLKHTKEPGIETQEPNVSTKSKALDSMKSVLNKDSGQSKDIEQIKAVPSKDYEREKDSEQSKEKSYKTDSLEKDQNSPKETLENSNEMLLSNKIACKDVNTALNDSSEEKFTLVYVSDAEGHGAVSIDCEVINEIDAQQHIQDELLSLAELASDSEHERPNEQIIQDELLTLAAEAAEKVQEKVVENKTSATEDVQAQTSMSDIISSSIDFIYKRDSSAKRKFLNEDASEAKKPCPNQSNVFFTTHEETSSSPTRQILAQSMLNIEDSSDKTATNIPKPLTMAERLSQRFKDLNTDNKTPKLAESAPKGNTFEKLINDTLKELEMEKDSISKHSANEATPSVSPAPSCSSISSAFSQDKANVVDKNKKPPNDLVKEQNKPKDAAINQSKLLEKSLTMPNTVDKPKESLAGQNKNTPTPTQEIITVISDDEDWEDIEITETAPAVPSSSTGNINKSKNKGLFQKFGLFKGNKNKKHLTPLAFMPKKKNKDKTPITSSSNTTTNTTPVASPSNPKPNITSSTANNTNSINTASSIVPTATSITSTRSATNSPFAHLRHNLGFKPVINIMDDLLPDSPCNDPIDLVPELAPLEPLQDLNDISSILDSNLSAVNINVNNNQTSIEEALDFVNEQQQQQIQDVHVLTTSQNSSSNCSSTNISTLTSTKSVVNSIFHVGFSRQLCGENSFKFYCLLENCSFLFSSDAVGLETHFMMEHSQIKWNGYCYMCQTQCVNECTEGLSITKEIKHMMDKHANNTVIEITNNDSNSCSTVVEEDRPKIKLRRLTGDCLSRSTPEITPTTSTPSTTEPNVLETDVTATKTKSSLGSLMLGALLEAKPKPPTIEMPPQPEMPLTEPLLLNSKKPVNKKPQTTKTPSSSKDGKTVSWIRVGDVTVLLDHSSPLHVNAVKNTPTPTPPSSLQIASVVSLNPDSNPSTPTADPLPVPKISNMRSITPKASNLLPQQTEKQHMDESASESWEVSRILANANNTSATIATDSARKEDDSPVIVAETVPIAQNKTGDFVITQTLSAEYNDSSSAHLGFNINIAATATGTTTPDSVKKNTSSTSATVTSTTSSSAAVTPSSGRVTSRQYKCMAAGCKFVSRVPVAMSDHLRFHERRNFSNKRDYFSCGFCFYTATDVEDYMKHADQYHIISKTGAPPPGLSNSSETDTATSLTKKILNILNSSGNNSDSSSTNTTSSVTAIPSKQMSMPAITPQVQDTEEVYLKKLRDTIDEIVGPTGLADDKLYRCVIKNCQTRLTESTFLSHIMYHINTSGQNAQHYTYKCPHCSAQYNRASGIKVHIKNHARNRYFCYLCEQTTANPGQLLKHFSEKHWHTIQMHTKLLLKPKLATDGSNQVLDSGYYVVYTQDLSDEELRKFGEKLILDWQRKKAGSKTHFKSSEIDLLPMTAIFTRDINCGECEYKTKVRTNMYRHLQMHKQNPDLANKAGVAKVYSVDPVNPVPCLNSSERFFDKMTNLASSSLIPNTSNAPASANSKSNYKIPYAFIEPTKRLTCHLKDCNYQSISEELFRSHMTTLHSNTLVYRCGFCQEEICKRGITTDRIFNHLRFHGACIYRCEECNYLHPLRYVVERHINEKHSKMKVNIVKHERTIEDNMEGMTTLWPFAGKKYKESTEPAQASATATRALNSENSTQKVSAAPSTSTSSKGKGKWICDECGQKAASVTQIQTHCQQQHGVKNQYKCVHCTFGSQQLSLILSHIDGQHSGMVREARTMYHRVDSGKEKIADTRPLWQRNDPTRVRHIRGILMEDEEESLNITEDDLADDNDMGDNEELEIEIEVEEGDEVLNGANYLIGYEFGCFHCDYKAQTFDELKEQHYKQQHNNIEDKAKPFWFHLLRKFCCPECRAFVGIYKELESHLKTQHGKNRFYGADVTTMESADNTLRLLCGYCPVHCANADDLLKHQLRLQHAPQDVRIDNDQQIMDILNLGHAEVAYQCTLCTDIFPNRVAIVDHACNTHAGEESFSFRELSNSLIYRCHVCCFTSTTELDLMRHMIDHYTRFKSCKFCDSLQTSFTVYMQHCYAQHKNVIHKFKTLYPVLEIRNFLLHMLVVFPSGLVLNKRNLLNTKYGKTEVIDELYEEMYKISQEPPIPRLSIARLVARKSIEAQHKHVDMTKKQDDILDAMQAKPKPISKRRRTLVVTLEENKTATGCSNTMLKPKLNVIENKPTVRINKRRTTVDQHEQKQPDELSAPLQMAKISKRRRTVAVDRDTLFSSNLSSNSYTNLLMEKQCKKRKYSLEMSEGEINYPLNLDMEPFSFYGQKPEPIDLSKIYTKIAIGGINTPLTIDKFKLLFNIECQLKLTKCDEETNKNLTNYNQYKHIKKACPASHKIRYK